MVHLLDQLRKFGPCRNQWCMQIEAQNSFFKRKKLKTTKSLPMSVAYDHQYWIASQQRDSDGSLSENHLKKHCPSFKTPAIYRLKDLNNPISVIHT